MVDRGDEISGLMHAISAIESGHNYNKVGPATKYGRARGRYQIMDEWFDQWAREAGVEGDYEWIDPDVQDQIARHKMTQYYNQFGGNPQAVAVAWFAGPGKAEDYVSGQSLNEIADVLGTNVPQYVNRFNQHYQPPAGVMDPETKQIQGAPQHWERDSINLLAQQVENRFGVTMTSHCRDEQKNREVGGAEKSDHLWCGAFDVGGDRENLRQVAEWAENQVGDPGDSPFRIVLHPWNDSEHSRHVHISFHRNDATPVKFDEGEEFTPQSFAPEVEAGTGRFSDVDLTAPEPGTVTASTDARVKNAMSGVDMALSSGIDELITEPTEKVFGVSSQQPEEAPPAQPETRTHFGMEDEHETETPVTDREARSPHRPAQGPM